MHFYIDILLGKNGSEMKLDEILFFKVLESKTYLYLYCIYQQ